MSDALREAPASLWRPNRHSTRGSRECRAFTDTQRKPGGKQAGEPSHQTGHRRRDAHDQTADTKRQPRAEFVAKITADQLEYRIWIGERRKRESELCIGQVEIRLDQRCRR